jgi:hypothetical protein
VEGSYFEVEHFYHKKKHPKKVVEWTNLLPSCKRCNLHKGEHDVKKTPIIDPAQVNPKKHLYFRDYRINGKTTLGKKTVTVLQLNETDKVVMKRYTVGQEVYERLQDILNDINVFVSNSVGNKNRIQNRFKELLKAAYPDCAYCASNSTIIFNSPDFKEIKKQFKSIGLWDTELGKLEKIISSFALSCK